MEKDYNTRQEFKLDSRVSEGYLPSQGLGMPEEPVYFNGVVRVEEGKGIDVLCDTPSI